MIVRIPLLDAIKEVPIYTKAIKEACIKKPRRKNKDPRTIHVLGQYSDMMLDKLTLPNYYDLGVLWLLSAIMECKSKII